MCSVRTLKRIALVLKVVTIAAALGAAGLVVRHHLLDPVGSAEQPQGPPPPEHGVPPRRLRVFGAGYGRTGTASVANALRELGFHVYHGANGEHRTRALPIPPSAIRRPPVVVAATTDHSSRTTDHHLLLVLSHPAVPADAGAWAGFHRTHDHAALFRHITQSRGFDATLDFPTSLLFKHALEFEPDVRVLLTVRSSPRQVRTKRTTRSVPFVPVSCIIDIVRARCQRRCPTQPKAARRTSCLEFALIKIKFYF